jgi:sugar phosphate isomerase/epimerase
MDLSTTPGQISLACSTLAWGRDGFVDAVEAISEIGFDGVECPARLVREYEDRLHVFEEILEISKLKLCAMLQSADFLDREAADETVERVANTARFLGAVGTTNLVVSPRNPEQDLTDDDWTTVAAIIEEMGDRCAEFGVRVCFRPRAGYVGGTDKEMKRLLEIVEASKVGLACDTAELLLSGISLDRYSRTWGERTHHLRVRDASGAKRRQKTTSTEPGRAPQFGRGALDIGKLGKFVASMDYSGWVAVEIAGEDHPPREAAENAFRQMIRKSGLFL